jgi:cell wall assembly regulator SMI1
MNIDHLVVNFEKRKLKNGLVYVLGKPALEEHIINTEEKLDVCFPDQIRMFYNHYNGVMVKEPALEILNLERLTRKDNLIHFSVINSSVIIFLWS